MAKIKYNLEAFDDNKAAQGALCVMVPSTYTAPEGWIVNVDDNGNANPNFVGAGICTLVNGNTFLLTIDSVEYQFNSEGNGEYPVSIRGYKLMMGTVADSPTLAGNMSKSSTTTTTITTRADGTVTKTDYSKSSNVLIDNLNARDEFAIHALRELLCHIPDPSAVSDSEMNFYCDKAYRWAANMMSASANARGTFTNEDAKDNSTSNTDKADVPATSLTSNTEKLLNNIVAALEKTDYAEKDPNDSTKVKAYHERVKLQFTELMDFLNAYIKKDEKTNLGLKDLIASLESICSNASEKDIAHIISALGNLNTTLANSKQDFSGIISAINAIRTALNNLDVSADYSTLENKLDSIATKLSYLPSNLNQNFYNIGSSGLGRNKDNPLYITGGGGGFPSRQVLAAALASDAISDFLTFNSSGAVGYSTKDEVKKAILGWYNSYASVDALYNAMESKIDSRIKAWLAKVTVTVDSKTYNLTVPSSI